MRQVKLLNKGLLVGVIVAIGMMVGVENGFSALVNNPMTENLDGGGYDMFNVTSLEATSAVTTDFITKGPWVDARAYNGGAFNNTTITAALNAIGTSQKTLLLAPGTWQISNFITIPSNVNLRFEQGAILNISLDTRVTINGPIDAPISQIFSGSGTVGFGPGYVKEVYPQWWGAVGDNSHNDTTALQKCLNAVPAGGLIFIPRGTYKITTQLDIPSDGITIRGAGNTSSLAGDGTYLKGVGITGYVFSIGAGIQEIEIEDLNILGDSECTGGGIYIGHDSQYDVLKRVNVSSFKRTSAAGIVFGSASDFSWGARLYGVRVHYCYDGIRVMNNNNDIGFYGCVSQQNDRYGLYVERAVTVSVWGGDWQSNRVHNVHLAGAVNFTMQNAYMEASYGGGLSYTETDVNNHRSVYIEQYNSTYASDNVRLINNYFATSDNTNTYFANYAVEIKDNSLMAGEISYNYLWKFNVAAIKNGTGNRGLAYGNNLKQEQYSESYAWSTLFDSEEGWEIKLHHRTNEGFSQSANYKKLWATSFITTTLLTHSPAADWSYIYEAYVSFRRMGTADTNGYRIFCTVERDGLNAPTIIGQERIAHEDIAGDDCVFAVNGNNIELQYTASGTGGQVHFKYSIIGQKEM